MRLLWLLPLGAALVYAQGSPGIRPRADASDYPIHQTGARVTIGAAIIPSAEVRKAFATNLDGYVVIEVGVYPDAGGTIDLSPADFTLIADASSISERAVDADAVAANLTKGQEQTYPRNGRSANGSVTAGVGIGTGTDPTTGRRIGSGVGVIGTAGNGGVVPADCRTIACGDPTPASPADAPSAARRRADMEQELWTKSLPDGGTAKPVAGYLHFPKPPSKAKNAAWILQWDGVQGRVKLEVQSAGKC